MAWQDMQKTMKLLAALSEMGKDGKTAGGQQPSGKATGGKGAQSKKRLCPWADCAAAQKKQPTVGGGPNCHCCRRPFASTPPLERLVDWAYQERLKTSPTAKTGAGKGGKGKTTGAPPTTKTDPTDEDLKKLREQRLGELKAVEAGKPPQAQKPDLTPLQQVAAVFTDNKAAKVTVKVAPEVVEASKALDAAALEVVTSLQTEVYPAETTLKHPQEVLDALLAKTSTFRKDAGFGQAEAEWKTTAAVISTMRSGNADPNDEILSLMVTREAKQRKELDKLRDAKPSQPLRKEALLVLRQEYVKSLQAQEDGWKLGASKALSRAAIRTKAVDALFAAAQMLRDLTTEATKEVSAAHGSRTAAKRTQGAEVLDLMDVQLEDLENESIQWADAMDSIDSEPTTETEDVRDEAKRLTALLEEQVLRFRQAAATAEAKVAEQEAAMSGAPAAMTWDALDDLRLNFNAEPSLLPTIADPMPKEIEGALDTLAALFTAVPWGVSLPALTFEQLGINPATAHTLLGNTMWEECWGERQGRINGKNFVPTKMLNILKWLTEQAALHLESTALTKGQDRYCMVEKVAAERRRGGSPY